MDTPAIETIDLVKRYGNLTALDHVNLQAPSGKIYALLGPNGAGKTTLLSILTTLLPPTAGTARILGYDVSREAAEVRRRIGVTFQEMVLDPLLTGRETLDFHGRLYRLPAAVRRQRIRDLVELVQLTDAIDRPVKSYSGGMKRRLELARGLMTDPQVLVLDEPTQGLDPQNRVNIWQYVRDLNRQRGMTILLTTHAMDEAEALADLVGIIDHGRLIVEGQPTDLIASLGSDVIRVRGQGDSHHLTSAICGIDGVQRVETDPTEGLILIYTDNGSRRLPVVLSAVSGNGFAIEDVTLARPSLGDVFLHYTGTALRD
ncbi:MAG: daunorubicin ABC transporter ATP-binding protein [Chloroflexus sp.]|jgi:ABC-2 type transport system ATP-binding protein|uniref:Daunorubicin resistance ABC transporter ATPase subunit n=1 Tax=Chloroflexus aurantiacus (strain ATCC 29366 / DSM 635 / J-10-fl) TaxID=324602 RepID=A9WBJ3_CHLAA|nr:MULTISPECIES: ATP-binding cassette domain-containing protein [Chloroflexus]RMG46558.1 MAG: daunorubicin ABC transporter ATP-binding protein [Chloroflexota bacterium]ABY33400.1 daunorubicin resistance ABC transporter ATPase subunit [Chloroflexus aurantiacus J-10-fl]GIV86765.1 MAG: daunorubicin ABC transporter ATP-binding protein [Chloroflexus sp.]GIV92936.1 MAG: daunorubicin ABC transporter ATP-binding protein [Chloroflexus sp.]HBW66704.1 daunorubicin ABC transporter ATP-binding protein [Chl